MKAEDLRTKTEDELKKLLLDARKDQFNMRFQRSNGQLEKTHGMRKVRRDIARIKTFLNMKNAEEQEPKKAAPKATKKKAVKKDKKDAA